MSEVSKNSKKFLFLVQKVFLYVHCVHCVHYEPRWPSGGGGTGDKPACAGWPSEQTILAVAITWRGWGGGGQYKMYKSIIFMNFISRSKKFKPEKLKLYIYEANVESISCCD
jgi:hypothetical protein